MRKTDIRKTYMIKVKRGDTPKSTESLTLSSNCIHSTLSYILPYTLLAAFFLLTRRYRKPVNICLLWHKFNLIISFSPFMYPNSNQITCSQFPDHSLGMTTATPIPNSFPLSGINSLPLGKATSVLTSPTCSCIKRKLNSHLGHPNGLFQDLLRKH